jgi:PAS domain S-box-containing protein
MAAESKLSLNDIRRRAEAIASQKPLPLPVDKAKEMQALVQELHIHQIELEIQNEELRATQIYLEQARNRYSDLFNNAPVGYLVMDHSGFIKRCNQTFAGLLDQSIRRLEGTPLADWLTTASRQIFLSKFKAFFKHPQGRRIDLQVKRGQGDGPYVSLHGSLEQSLDTAPSASQPPERVRIVVIDITEQRAAEIALKNAYAELSLRQQVADIMLKNDLDGMYSAVLDRVLVHFKAKVGFFGYIDTDGSLVCPSMSGRVWAKCNLPGKTNRFPASAWGGIWGESLKGRKAVCKHGDLALPEGHMNLTNALAVPIMNRERLVGLIVIAERPGGYDEAVVRQLEIIATWIAPVIDARLQRDRQLALRTKAENDLRQAQRMESIGVLAGGIAHDFNNILSPIIGYTDMLLDAAETGAAPHTELKEVSKAAHRAKDLVGQLLAFSRKQMLDVQTLDVNARINDIAKMFKRLIREDIALEYRLQPSIGAIKADPGQIDQILLNLVVNAQDAMPGGGQLKIGTASRHLDEPMTIAHFQVDPGAYTVITVTDTGTGIDAEVLPFVFEPFFTTKDRGQGTGMGLATCYGIVKQHGGYIWPQSEVGRGTTFTLMFPVADRQPMAAAAMAGPIGVLQQSRGETIMVVEDEPAVRKMAVLALRRLGYRVLEMASPEACMQTLRDEGTNIDLLLSDVIMPGCNGRELYAQLQVQKPDLKVLFMSGYTDNVISAQGGLGDGPLFIAKPFTLNELSLKVRTVLDGA